jgi:hypothetical protein
MPNGSRVVFLQFPSSQTAKLGPWQDHARRVAGVIAEVVSADSLPSPVVTWQLVSANNRKLARSARLYPHFEAAESGALAVIDGSEMLETRLVSDSANGMYGWHAVADGSSVITCSRWYATERDRRYSIDLALGSIATAYLQPGVRQIASVAKKLTR